MSENSARIFVIARTSVVYGWHQTKSNFATWVVDSLKNQKSINVVEDHYNSPTLADDLATMISKLIDRRTSGIYHTAGSTRISRYEFALRIAETFGLDKSLIIPVKMNSIKSWIAKRPSRFITSR